MLKDIPEGYYWVKVLFPKKHELYEYSPHICIAQRTYIYSGNIPLDQQEVDHCWIILGFGEGYDTYDDKDLQRPNAPTITIIKPIPEPTESELQ